jgi:hypothetical protein
MHWKNISKNPVSLKVHKFLLEELRQKKVITDTSHEDLLQKFVEGHSVLDIGVVDHDISHIQSGGWKHRKLKKFAKKIVFATFSHFKLGSRCVCDISALKLNYYILKRCSTHKYSKTRFISFKYNKI